MSDDNQKAILAALADLTGRVDRLQDTVGADQVKLRIDLIWRMDRLQDTVTAIRDDIAVNMGAADAAVRVNPRKSLCDFADNTRADLRSLQEQAMVMWRQLKAVKAKVRDITGSP